MMILPKLYN